MAYEGTQLDAAQAVRAAFNDADQAFRVDATITADIGEIVINHEDDSIALGTTAALFTGTTVGPDFGLDVNVIGGSITSTNPSVGTIGATSPTYATEMGAVDSSGNLQPLTVDPSGKLLVDITGSSTVTGTVNANIEGLNVWQASVYAVGSSAVQLTPTPLSTRSSLSVKVITTGGNVVYIGNSSAVTTSSNCYPLFNGDSIQLDLTPSDTIYAISTVSGQTVYVLEIGS